LEKRVEFLLEDWLYTVTYLNHHGL